jgi:hypothetical protein
MRQQRCRVRISDRDKRQRLQRLRPGTTAALGNDQGENKNEAGEKNEKENIILSVGTGS